ncbi:MAG: hypothetical protein EKK42_34300 [Pseudonocardiaceae bacterium]|nr:MAG: hypothetical protein EKK42_34300 [Pseudonocardiaceae bacterium]
MDDTSPDADAVERALAAARRIVVPVLAVLLVVAAVTAGALHQNDVSARYGLHTEVATVVATESGTATVTWLGVDGAFELGTVPSTGDLELGSSTHVVLDPDGRLTTAAVPSEARTAGVVRAAGVLAIGGAALVLLFVLLGHAGRVRAAARLDDEWRAAEMRWRTSDDAPSEDAQ